MVGGHGPIRLRPATLANGSSPPVSVLARGNQASLTGDAALYFAPGWAASAHGGQVAALVLALFVSIDTSGHGWVRTNDHRL